MGRYNTPSRSRSTGDLALRAGRRWGRARRAGAAVGVGWWGCGGHWDTLRAMWRIWLVVAVQTQQIMYSRQQAGKRPVNIGAKYHRPRPKVRLQGSLI